MFFVPDVAMDEQVNEQEDGPAGQAPPGVFHFGRRTGRTTHARIVVELDKASLREVRCGIGYPSKSGHGRGIGRSA